VREKTLSPAALALFRCTGSRIVVDDSNRAACRELASEGVLTVGHSFTGGREAFYVPTALGRKLAEVLDRISEPLPAESASPRP
jgi:hypothetical protein